MDLMIHVSSRDAGSLLVPLAEACGRAGIAWACFFTNDGVTLLKQPEVVAALESAARTVVCEHSWDLQGGGDCPIEAGSQTVNSALMAEAARVVSL